MKKIIFIIMIMLLMTLPISLNVNAATTIFIDFESGIITEQYNTSNMVSTQLLGSDFEVNNYQVWDGSKSFACHESRGAWNFTSDFVSIDFMSYHATGTGNQWSYIYMYSREQVLRGDIATTDAMIYLRYAVTTVNRIEFYDANGYAQKICNGIWNSWFKNTITCNDYDNITYNMNGNIVKGTPYNVSAFSSGEQPSYILITNIFFNMNVDFDNINITYGTIGGTETQYSQSDLDEYTPIGPGSGSTGGSDVYHCGSSYSSPLEIYGNRPYIEQQGPQIAGIIRGFDLYTNEIQYDLTHDLSDYELYINRVYCGNPSYFFESGDNYILRWVDFEVNCTNEAPVIEVAQDTTYRMMYVSFMYQEAFYWFNVGTRIIQIPEGFVGPIAPSLANHGNVNLFGNNVLDGSPLYTSDFPCMPSGPGVELYYTIYYEEFEDLKIIDYPELEDSLFARMPREYTTYPCYVSATVEQMSSGNAQIELAIDNITSTAYSFPVLVDKPKFYYDFVPTVSGYYVFNLTQGGNTIATDSVYVNDIYNLEDSDYLLWTIPPRNGRTGFDTFYHYNNGAGLDGVVAIFKYKDNSYYDMNDKKVYGQLQLYHALKRENIEDNGNGSFIFSYNSGIEKYEYHIIMFVKTASGEYEEVKRYVHEISSPYDIYDDYVYVSPKTSYVSEKNPIAKIKISGQHSLYGSYIYLQINNNTIADLSYNDNFEIYYQTANPGSYYVTIVQRTGSIWNVLANNSFIVIDTTNIDESENVFTLPKISSGIGFILGLIVTMVSMLIPLMLVTFINAKTKTEVKIPVLVFGISGGLGIAVSVGLGFFPFWIVPFIAIIGIIIVAIFYIITNKGGEGGE